MLEYLGAGINEEFLGFGDEFVHQVSIDGSSKLIARDFRVPSDVSSAAFFIVGAACLKNSDLLIENIGLNPTRTAIIEVLYKLGAKIEVLNKREVCNELIGDLRVRGEGKFAARDQSNIISGEIIPNLIDEIPILAVLGTQIENGLEVREAEELRVKESDRIKAIVENLRRMNARVEEFPDGFRVEKSSLRGAEIDSFGDHRIAMAFSIAGLLADGETVVTGAESASVSFPDFFQTLEKIIK
jgi:3-phosphoshikimate 1-carboxyvinyltransferase